MDAAARRLMFLLLCIPLAVPVIALSAGRGGDGLVLLELPPYVLLAVSPFVFGRAWPSVLVWLAVSALVVVVNIQTGESTRSTAALGYLIPPALVIPLAAILVVGGVTRFVWRSVRAVRAGRGEAEVRSGYQRVR